MNPDRFGFDGPAARRSAESGDGHRTVGVMGQGHVLGPGEGKVVPLPGATMVFKALGGRTAGDYDIGEFTAEPGFPGPRPHLHRTHEELFYVLAGEFDFFVGDRVVRVGPGGFVAVPPGVVHDFRNPTSRPARWLAFVAPGGLDRYFDEVKTLADSGRLTPEAMRELRLRYDTEEPDHVPDGHWASRS
jgi:mannose-6-phosphate isomerase-like protein (cupin superfamily)